MRIEMNKIITIESLEMELSTMKEELSRVKEETAHLAKQLKALMDKEG